MATSLEPKHARLPRRRPRLGAGHRRAAQGPQREGPGADSWATASGASTSCSAAARDHGRGRVLEVRRAVRAARAVEGRARCSTPARRRPRRTPRTAPGAPRPRAPRARRARRHEHHAPPRTTPRAEARLGLSVTRGRAGPSSAGGARGGARGRGWRGGRPRRWRDPAAR